jgi:type II secretory pathway predicted ATPase ExeA
MEGEDTGQSLPSGPLGKDKNGRVGSGKTLNRKEALMNACELMYVQSKVNPKPYNGDDLAIQNWAWPQETWFQQRLRHLRQKAQANTSTAAIRRRWNRETAFEQANANPGSAF